MPRAVALALLILAAAAPVASSYAVSVAHDQFIGGFTSGIDQLAAIYFPTDGAQGETFPLISFAHGIFSGGQITDPFYHNLLTGIASHGYVVVALDVCATTCVLSEYARDHMHVIDAVRGGSNPLFKLANTTHVGIAGHSYGADSTLLNLKKQREEVKAAWSFNPCQGVPGLIGPIQGTAAVAVTTGTVDTVCNPYGVLSFYNMLQAPSKLYFSLQLATHLEIEDGYPQRPNAYVGHFFDCHVKGVNDSCGRMYGGSGHNGVCKDLPMYECHKA